jgi:hypothetical protein
MNNEHHVRQNLPYDFNGLEGRRSMGFLNIKGEGVLSYLPFLDRFRVADHSPRGKAARWLSGRLWLPG